uniref:F-box domain-containing protein n=1 Tax=Oryza glumipatula TaxID=40148 RepID=A0A0E0BSY3_9ORYZ
MDGDDDRWGHVHRDIFGEILKRLPPISGRRRIRLICRRWRDGVDEMEPEMATTMRAKPLAVLKDSRSRTLSAFVVDGLPPAPRRATTRCIFQHVDDGGGGGGHHRHRYDRWPNNVGDQVVGTCNGILLLAHSRYLDLWGGRLSLGVEGMAWWSGDGRCAGWPWAGMTTATPFGTVPLLGGVVLVLTPHNTKNPLRAMVALVDSCNVLEALQV